jgi:hypothetical protein
VVFEDPKRTEIEIFSEHKLMPIPPFKGGVVPMKLGHIAFSVEDPKAIGDFYGGWIR